MVIKSATFLKSSKDHTQSPDSNKVEIALIGRSNVGKSSLINMISQRRNLAKISSTPGKTQLINHFLINDIWYLVDLPGYGWAKASKTDKAHWEAMIRNYLLERENLAVIIVLIDLRHAALEIDLKFLSWLGTNRIPFAICFTKSDKLSSTRRKAAVAQYRDKLLDSWEWLPPIFVSSAKTQSGKKELLDYFEEVINEISSQNKSS